MPEEPEVTKHSGATEARYREALRSAIGEGFDPLGVSSEVAPLGVALRFGWRGALADIASHCQWGRFEDAAIAALGEALLKPSAGGPSFEESARLLATVGLRLDDRKSLTEPVYVPPAFRRYRPPPSLREQASVFRRVDIPAGPMTTPSHAPAGRLFALAVCGGHAGAMAPLAAAGVFSRGLAARPAWPLCYAAVHGSVDVARALLSALPPDAVDLRLDEAESRLAPLHLASDSAVALALLAAGADARARDSQGREPLHYAGDAALVAALLGAGAQLEAQDARGCTPLLAASEGRLLAVVEALIEAGANLDAKDRLGRGAAQIAREARLQPDFEDPASVAPADAVAAALERGAIERRLGDEGNAPGRRPGSRRL